VSLRNPSPVAALVSTLWQVRFLINVRCAGRFKRTGEPTTLGFHRFRELYFGFAVLTMTGRATLIV
jgi:hypothetical protein